MDLKQLTLRDLGSSPHTWRIQHAVNGDWGPARIISTYVENTYRVPPKLASRQDHLHIRGEYQCKSHYFHCLQGSSPHTWRILAQKQNKTQSERIISTYVENTSKHPLLESRNWDHLHIRGEYYQQNITFISTIGSSPHTWRIQCASHWFSISFRIISTYVENTVCILSAQQGIWDHLHIRGEYTY